MAQLAKMFVGICCLGVFMIGDVSVVSAENIDTFQNPKESMAKEDNSFFTDLSIGLEYYSWLPNTDIAADTSISKVFKFSTEGAALYKASVSAGYGNKSYLTLSYEGPLSQSENQEDIIEFYKSQSSGLEKFTGGIKLDPIVDLLLQGDSLGVNFLRNLLSVRYKAIRERYYGEATTLVQSVYIDDNTVFHPNHTVTGSKIIPAGSSMAFRTDFSYDDVTIPVLRYPESELRIGYYKLEWARPAELNVTVGGNFVVCDAKFVSEGLVVSYEPTDSGAPGLQADFTVRLGIKDDYIVPFDWNNFIRDSNSEALDVGSGSIDIGLWYNYYLSNVDKGMLVSLGGTVSFVTMNVDVNQITNTGSSTTDYKRVQRTTEFFIKPYITISYRF